MNPPIKEGKNSLTVLVDRLEACEDYRELSKVDYPLAEILFLVFCSNLCGCESYEELIDFGHLKLEWLRKYLPYVNGIPSHDTVNRVMSLLNTRELERVLVDYANYQLELPDGALVQIDGKRISGSATAKDQQIKKAKGGKQAVNMVNVFCREINSCLSSLRVRSKKVEHQAIGDILELLDLSKCLLTLDAAYCYKNVASQIKSADADYLIGLKENQPNLLAAAKEVLAQAESEDRYEEQKEKNRNRLEQRICRVVHIDQISEHIRSSYSALFNEWKGLSSFIEIRSYREDQTFQLPKNKAKSKKKNEELRYYICSQTLSAKASNYAVREHWGIENGLHWILDVIMGEDKSKKRVRNAAANYSIFRKLAYNKLKAFDDGKVSIRRRIKKCMMNEKYMENILK